MYSLLCIISFSLCIIKLTLSSPAGIFPRGDKTEIRVKFNMSGFLSLQTLKNDTISSPINYRMSGFIDLTIPHNETFGLRKDIADWDDTLITEREPVFRKDYSLDEKKQGWFKLHRVPDSWENARERCELEGAELASPLDTTILEAMRLRISENNLYSVFTGVHSKFSYGDYYSLKGVPLGEMPVKWSRDLSSDMDRRCMELLRDDSINNVKCDSKLPYICYKKNDYTPLTECGTIDTEYTLNKQLNRCYKLHKDLKTWEDAFKTCSAEGGYLVVIDNDAEFATVIQTFNKDINSENNMDYSVFVGITSSTKTNQWVSIHDTKLKNTGFSTWSLNAMLNSGPGYCGVLKRSGYQTIPCFVAPFVCEKEPDSLITMYQLLDITNPSNNF